MKQWYLHGTLLPSSEYHAGSSNVYWSCITGVVGGVYNWFNMKIPHSTPPSAVSQEPSSRIEYSHGPQFCGYIAIETKCEIPL